MKNKWISTLFALALFKICSAQESFAIKGIVQIPIQTNKEGIVVNLYQQNKLLKTELTDSIGQFEFQFLTQDSLRVSIQHDTYGNYLSEFILFPHASNPIVLQDVTLSKNQVLQQVTIASKIPYIKRSIDRVILNPEGLISSAGTNAWDMLGKAPGIILDNQGGIKLKGKSGVTILIDDKPTYLSGADLENYLKALPTASIKQIEVIPNPPANYDAAGNSGIVIIRTKRSKLKGLNGNLSLNYAQSRFSRSNDNLSLNYAKNKWAFYSSIGVSIQNNYQDLYIYRKYKNSDLSTKSFFRQQTDIRIRSNSFTGRIGMDYYVSQTATLGFSMKGLISPSRVNTYNQAYILSPKEEIWSQVIADNVTKNLLKNTSYNANYRKTIGLKGKQITADLDYVNYQVNLKQAFLNDVFLPDGTHSYHDLQQGSLPTTINIYSFKSDYTQPIPFNIKMDAGIKVALSNTDNNAIYLTTIDGITDTNFNMTNHFLYTEWIGAAYANFTKSFKRLDAQLGLRFERTTLDGNQKGNSHQASNSFERSYSNLFPTLFLNYRLDSLSKHVITLNTGRRINRPYYKDLNPFVSPLDKYTYYVGNPILYPTFSNNIALSYTYNNMFTLTGTITQTINNIQETIEINNGIYYSRPNNIGSSWQYNMSAETNFALKPFWNLNAYSEVVYSEFKSKLYTETLNAKGIYWFINGANTFTIKKKYGVEINGQFITDFIDAQFGFRNFGFVGVAASAPILKKKGSLKLNISDLFHSNRIYGTIYNLQLTDAGWRSITDSRIASLTFSYRFGKNTNPKQRYNGNGAESETKRVKG